MSASFLPEPYYDVLPLDLSLRERQGRFSTGRRGETPRSERGYDPDILKMKFK